MKTFTLQFAKLVGSPNSTTWSQTHVFLPEDQEKKLKFGSLLASFSLKAKVEGLDIALFGKEIISRFQEIYYSSLEKTVFLKLSLAVKALTAEFKDKVDIQVAAAVVVWNLEKGLIGYFSANIKNSIFVFRNNQLLNIFKNNQQDIKTASGFLQNKDMVILATSQFWQIIALGTLKAALANNNANQALEMLAPIIHGHKLNSQAAGVIFKINKKAEKKIKLKKIIKAKSFILNWKQRIKALKRPKIRLYLPQKKELDNLRIKDEEQKKKAKKTTLTVALILLLLLIISVFLGIKKKSALKQTKSIKTLLSEVNYKYDEAMSLKEINPLRARLLLTEAKDLIDKKKADYSQKEDQEAILKLADKINQEMEAVAKAYKLEKADIFLDLSLAKENFKGKDWGVDQNALYVFDSNLGTILKVIIKDKSTEVVAGGKAVVGGDFIGANSQRIGILKAKKLLLINIKRGEIVDKLANQDWGQIKSLVGFSGNFYLLDADLGQIWKYRGTAKGLAKKITYLKGKEYDLSSAVSMAIDGSVWLLFNDGEVVKYTRGRKDNFHISGLDKPLLEPTLIYTSAELENLYIVDQKNTRVVVINKTTGEYQSQYIWPGIAGASAIAAFEKEQKILLLTGKRIYEIKIHENY